MPEQQPTFIQQLVPMIPFIAIFIVMFYMMSASSRKEKKKKAEMMNNLKKDAKVQTIGGIIGTVEEVLNDEVKITVDPRTKTTMTFAKASISNIL